MSRPSFVYFLRSGEGAIKIGTTNNIPRRLQMLQTGSAEPLHLLKVTEGGSDLERGLHAKLSAHRLNGEWFAPHADVLARMTSTPSAGNILCFPPKKKASLNSKLIELGVSKSYASQLSRGKREPSLTLAIKIFHELGLKIGPIAGASAAEIKALERVGARRSA